MRGLPPENLKSMPDRNFTKSAEPSRLESPYIFLADNSFCLIRLAQPIKISRILQVRLLQLCSRFVVIFLSERDPTRQLMSLAQLTRILLRLGALTKFSGILFRRREIPSR